MEDNQRSHSQLWTNVDQPLAIGSSDRISKPDFTELNARSVAAWRQSLAVDGGLLFNHMPSEIRNYNGNSLSGFKMTLDQLLERIPDRPLAQGLYPDPVNCVSGLHSNCLIDWSKYLKLCSRVSVDLVNT